MTNEQSPRSIWTDALLLAFVPAIGYALTVLHEVGYMNYFHIPSWLIRVDPATAFITSTYVLLFFFLALGLFYLVTPWLIEEFEKNTWVPYWLKSHSGILFPTILIGVYLLIPICFGARLPSGSFIYYLVCVCTALLIPCAFNRDLTKSLPKHLPVLLVILLFAGFWSYHWGVREAKRQKWFLVPEKTTDMVVFRIYDDNCITSKFDRPTKTTTPHLTIQPLGDADPKEAAVLRYEPVGPLIPWKKD